MMDTKLYAFTSQDFTHKDVSILVTIAIAFTWIGKNMANDIPRTLQIV